MIAKLSGILADAEINNCIVDVQGVGYEVQIPLSTYEKLPRQGEAVTLAISTQVREDAITLFGFATADEKRLFMALLGVSGIGGKVALSILSGMPAAALVAAIAGSDLRALSKINGVGKRTAERLVVELRDKITKLGVVSAAAATAATAGNDSRSAAVADAIQALNQLGIKAGAVEKIVQEIALELPEKECGSANLITLTLQRINKH